MDAEHTVHGLLLVNALEDVFVAERELYGIAGGGDEVGLDGYRVEQPSQSVPLCGEAIVASSQGDGVLEDGGGLPEGEVFERWPSLKQLANLTSIYTGSTST